MKRGHEAASPAARPERAKEELVEPLVAKQEVVEAKREPEDTVEQEEAEVPAAEAVAQPAPAEATVVAASAPLGNGIVAAALGSGAAAVRQRAQEWADLCQRDLRAAVREALGATLELAGLPGSLQAFPDVTGDPSAFLQQLPEWVRTEGLDLQVYPLLPTVKHGRRSLMNFERFWTFGVNSMNASTLLDGKVVATLSKWLLDMSLAGIRSLRHAATVAALAIAEALGHHYNALQRMHDTHKRQLESAGASNPRQKAQLQKNLQKASIQVGEMYKARSHLLEATVPVRSRDVSEVIRLYTLCEVDKLMKQDPEMYLSNKWTARVFLMIHDPAADVRLKAIQVIQSWYTGAQKSEVVREHLGNFAQRGLSHLVERIGDVDSRVATAALKCLRAPSLAESLEDEEFDKIVNLCIGAEDDSVREESALFINSHVFQDPGICGPVLEKRKRGRQAGRNEEAETMDGEAGGDNEGEGGPDTVKELYNSETSISMLVEYLENYVGEHLRVSDRVVAAFWSRAPALCHWGTMVNLCLVGESQRGASADPVSPRQRLALLYIMEASVRRAEEEFRNAPAGEKEAAAVKMNDACAKIIPELPRLLDICRPDEQHSLIFSHVCKMLLEYAVDNTQYAGSIIVNTKALCQGLRSAIENQGPLDTVKYCVDALLALARCFDEAKAEFLALAKAANQQCLDLLRPEAVGAHEEGLRAVLGRFVVLSNRGIDMTFGSIQMLNNMVSLLRARVEWQQGRPAPVGGSSSGPPAADSAAASEPAAAAVDDAAAAGDAAAAEGAPAEAPAPPGGDATAADVAGAEGSAAAAEPKAAGAPAAAQADAEDDRPSEVPDRRMALQLIEAATIAVMWHARMAFWVESAQGAGTEGDGAQASEMLQAFGELPALRAELPAAAGRLRATCAEMVAHDTCAYVQFHSFSAYMTMLQLAVGVSEKLSLELVEGTSLPTPQGGVFDVTVPMEHNQALWQYLNSFFIRLSSADSEGIKFDAEGFNVMTTDVYPAPSQGTMTSARFLTQRCTQPISPDAGGCPGRRDELLLAVLASRMVLESEVEEVHAGPLGLLLLTQCERGRPRPLREVATSAFRRLREIARVSEDLAVQFFRVQQEAVASLFECAGAEAAEALSRSFVLQWGLRLPPWLEGPHFVVLRDALASCITEDRRRLQLLDVFGGWVRFASPSRSRELAEDVRARCAEAGLQAEEMVFARRLLQRLGWRPAVASASAPNDAGAPAAAAPGGNPEDAAGPDEPDDEVVIVEPPAKQDDKENAVPQAATPAGTPSGDASKTWHIPSRRISGKCSGSPSVGTPAASLAPPAAASESAARAAAARKRPWAAAGPGSAAGAESQKKARGQSS